MSLTDLILRSFSDLNTKEELPEDIDSFAYNKEATLRSSAYSGGKFRRARVCTLVVPGKFTAETLVIYPKSEYDFPIFGTEYISIGNKKHFGAIDFHPISEDVDYADLYLSDFPDTDAESSKFYDLSKFFSKKFWLKKKETTFYNEYLNEVQKFLVAYRSCSSEAEICSVDSLESQRAYDIHMAENDPARGILKAYFSSDFAETYIHKFLFELAQ